MMRERNRGDHARRGIARRPLIVGAAAAAAAVAGAWLQAPPPVPRHRPPRNAMLDFFDSLGLMRGTDHGPAEPGWVRKWTRPVAVRIHGEPAGPALDQLEDVLATLSRWTRLPFRAVGDDVYDDARIDVHFVTGGTMEERFDGPVCHCATYGNGGRLHTGVIEIAEGYTDCLRHEFMHAIGFDNHWVGPHATEDMPSVLAHRYSAARSDEFSLCDELAIRMLYDPQLAPGMPRIEALPIARDLVDEVFDV